MSQESSMSARALVDVCSCCQQSQFLASFCTTVCWVIVNLDTADEIYEYIYHRFLFSKAILDKK